jgi:hypothetical protein
MKNEWLRVVRMFWDVSKMDTLRFNSPLQNGGIEECEDGVEKKGMTVNLRV